MNIPWYSASWWAAALYVVFVLVNHFLGLGLEVEGLIALLLPILAIIFGDKWVEVQRIKLEMMRLEVRSWKE